jgi:CheY-like chemotaxis protein
MDWKGQMSKPNVCRILVVDDNRDTVETLAMLLRLNGHEVETATDGAQAVENAVSFKPDVVLLDLGLPGMHGHEVCRHIREQVGPPRPLLVAVTGHSQQDVQRQSYAAGFDAHLLKPVDFDQLEQLIDGYCVGKDANTKHAGQCQT